MSNTLMAFAAMMAMALGLTFTVVMAMALSMKACGKKTPSQGLIARLEKSR